jgi:hypothetical protein
MKTPSMGLHQNRAVTYIQHGFFWVFSMGRIIIQDTWTTQKFEIRKGLGNGTKYEKHM